MRGLKYFIAIVVSVLLVIFIFRLAFTAEFDNTITNIDYWEYNTTDNQINNLDDINVTSKSFFNLVRSFPVYFKVVVEKMTKFNVFQSLAENTKDIVIVGAFLNFMSSVYTLIVYLVSIVLSLLQIILDITKYIFTIETIEITTTEVSIVNVG